MEENKTPETVEETVTPPATEEEQKPKEKKAPAKKKKENEFEKKYNELNDTYIRTLAEYDNYRKRTQKEKDTMFADGIVKAINTILPALDNLERAAMYSEAEAVAKGLELTLKSFTETFERLGIREIESMGKTFDPNVHNAVMHVDDEAYGESEIVEVLQKGYRKGDKILRYAMVKVAN